MRLEIRELVIKATIVPDAGTSGSGASGSSGATGSGNNNVSPNEELINTCVEKILEIIKEKDGR
jgi:hypothetical protein